MEQLDHFTSIAASIAAGTAAVAAPVAAFAAAPRVGPLRALTLGLRSRLFMRAPRVSQRTQELASLRAKLSFPPSEQYIIVSGPKGVGKSCIVNTVMQETFGVVRVNVQPGSDMEKINTDVFDAISGIPFRYVNPSNSARRVVWWHRLVFRNPPTVVLSALERQATQPFASVDGAARVLAGEYGLRVVIDASDNSLPESAKKTKRERPIEVPPMSRELLEQLPELETLHEALKAAKLADVVWTCVGGVPADYYKLHDEWQEYPQELERVVNSFTVRLLSTAAHNIRGQLIENKRLSELYDLFSHDGVMEVPESKLKDLSIIRPSPDKVLCLSRGRDYEANVLVPVDAATALVLRCKCRMPTAEELKAYATPNK